jgi:hypothetical protein
VAIVTAAAKQHDSALTADVQQHSGKHVTVIRSLRLLAGFGAACERRARLPTAESRHTATECTILDDWTALNTARTPCAS